MAFWRVFVTLGLNNKDQRGSLTLLTGLKSFWHHEHLFGQTYRAHDSITCNRYGIFPRNTVDQTTLKWQNFQKQGWHIFSSVLLTFYSLSHSDLVFFHAWGTYCVSRWTDLCAFPGNSQGFTSGANSFYCILKSQEGGVKAEMNNSSWVDVVVHKLSSYGNQHSILKVSYRGLHQCSDRSDLSTLCHVTSTNFIVS